MVTNCNFLIHYQPITNTSNNIAFHYLTNLASITKVLGFHVHILIQHSLGSPVRKTKHGFKY